VFGINPLKQRKIMQAFTFSTTRKIIVEPGAAARLGQISMQLGATKVMLITDKGIVAAGLLQQACENFDLIKLDYVLFDSVEADPSETTVLLASELARQNAVDLVIGFGGGSSMDVAKLVAVLAHPACKQDLNQCYGIEQISGSRLPLIQLATTAGTGSEVTPIAIVTTGESSKAGVVSEVLQPDIALLDANLTLGLPPHITAATGIDAMVHAIEAFTSVHKKNPLSDMLALQALQLLSANISTAVHKGKDLQARSNMLLGALLAGQAFANAPVAAVHALAYPLGGHFHIPHGLSNSLVLPHVMRFNESKAASLYAQLAPSIMGRETISGSDAEVSDALINFLQNLIAELGLPQQLRLCKVPEDSLPLLAKDAMLQQRLLINNPRQVSETDALAIYQAAY
jgi:alcohol dehydrogenase class IV